MGSRRFEEALGMVDHAKHYSVDQAVVLLKELPGAKFDETVELSVSLNIDPKKTDQVVRGTLVLPHGTGKTPRVLVFCKGETEIKAKAAGADYVGSVDLIEKIQGGWLDFDVAIATPSMMRDVSRLGKILGPRGMMPNPKTGTVTEDVSKAIQEVKQGKVEFKMDKLSNLHIVVGKRSFEPKQLVENSQAVMGALVRARPASLKGRMIRRISLSSTMSPAISLDTGSLEDQMLEAQKLE